MAVASNIYGANFDVDKYLFSLEGSRNGNNKGKDFRHLLSKEDKDQLSRFCVVKTADGRKPARVYKYAKVLVSWAQFLKGKTFTQLGVDDVKTAVAALERSSYSANSKVQYKAIFKIFFRWLKGCPDYKDPPETETLKCNPPKPKRYSSKEMLNDEDVSKLIAATSDAKLRALIALLSDSGMRIGELLSMRVKDVSFEDGGMAIHVPDDPGCKTGSRDIFTIASTGHVMQWMRAHPAKDTPNAYLFCNNKPGEIMSYNTLKKYIRDLATTTGLKKKHNFHFFRKSRATALAIAGWSQQQLNAYFGWVASSSMSSVYIQMTARDTKATMQRMYGIIPKENSVAYAKNLNCENCKTPNPVGTSFCAGCGTPLDGKDKELQDAELKRLERLLGLLKTKQNTKEAVG